MSNEEFLADIKTMLGIEDTAQDGKLKIIIKNVVTQLSNRLNSSAIPVNLEYIVTEVSIKRFNRIGDEGLTSSSVEGRSSTYAEDDFTPYLKDIEEYRQSLQVPEAPYQKGSVMFY